MADAGELCLAGCWLDECPKLGAMSQLDRAWTTSLGIPGTDNMRAICD